MAEFLRAALGDEQYEDRGLLKRAGLMWPAKTGQGFDNRE